MRPQELAALGELAAGQSIAAPAQIRDLVDRGVFAPPAEAALSTLWATAGGRTITDLESLIDDAMLAAARKNDREQAKQRESASEPAS